MSDQNDDLTALSDEELRARHDAVSAQAQRISVEMAARASVRAVAARQTCVSYTAKDEDLVYAAYSRCGCGAGLAYHKYIGIHGFWACSDVLCGRTPPDATHSVCLPFHSYAVKSEGQPSANGATTRKVSA
jgi:hypothetical protein